MSFTENNHYVPQWYQRRFFPSGLKEQKFYYFDLKPDKVIHSDGKFHFRNSIRRLGTENCFAEDHLYTLFFGGQAADVIEKQFFGKIDDLGAKAIEFFSNYRVRNGAGDAFRNLVLYLNAQKMRTPKGLEFLKKLLGKDSHQEALNLMGRIWQLYGTIWTEGVWEILECDQSKTKFIISDHPVTTYNRKIFPASKEAQHPFDAKIERVGTHTIFPLDLNRCLVVTNLEYVRFPKIDPLKVRENPRYFESRLFKLDEIQTGRQIPEREVRAINYIIKRRARRYIAAVEKEWLYPENFLKTQVWNKLGNKFFLMPDPRKVPFTTGISVGWNDGSSISYDEYGRQSNKTNPRLKAKRDFEIRTFYQSRKEWDEEFGALSPQEIKKLL